MPTSVIVLAVVFVGAFVLEWLMGRPSSLAEGFPRLVALIVGGYIVSRLAWRRLIVRRDRIEWHVTGLLEPHPPVILPFRDIETVTLARGGYFRRWRLRIAGDRHMLDIAQGLRRRDLEWLRDYLTFAAATA